MSNLKKPDVKIKALPFKLPDFFKTKPVFNRPVSIRTERIPRVLFISVLSILCAISAVVIGLKATTMEFIEENIDTGFDFMLNQDEPTLLGALPLHVFDGPAKLAIIVAVFSIFISLGHIGFLLRSSKDENRAQSYPMRLSTMFLHIVNSILIILATISLFATHKSSSHFNPDYNSRKDPGSGFGVDGVYDRGMFDIETWSCELMNQPGAWMVWEDYSKQCRIEMAGRWMMIPFILAGVSVAALAVTQMIGRKADESTKTVEELEMGKFNAI